MDLLGCSARLFLKGVKESDYLHVFGDFCRLSDDEYEERTAQLREEEQSDVEPEVLDSDEEAGENAGWLLPTEVHVYTVK